MKLTRPEKEVRIAVLLDVSTERDRQDIKFPSQKIEIQAGPHVPAHDWPTWNAIATEESGEVAQAVLNVIFPRTPMVQSGGQLIPRDGNQQARLNRITDLEHLKEEAIQAAAVYVRMAEEAMYQIAELEL